MRQETTNFDTQQRSNRFSTETKRSSAGQEFRPTLLRVHVSLAETQPQSRSRHTTRVCATVIRSLELGEQLLHLADLVILSRNNLLRERNRVSELSAIDLHLRHFDGSLVVLDHLFEEQL